MPLRRGPIHSDFYVLPMEERVQVQSRATAPKNEDADVSKAACTSLPPRPKWLSYPKMYRNSNKRAASQRTMTGRGRPTRGDLTVVDTPGSVAVADSTTKTSLSHFVLHTSSTPKTSQSSPSIPSSIQCCHSVDELHLDQPIDDAIPAVIVESSNGADEEEVENLEHEHGSVATPKARRAEPFKAIRKAFSRKKPEDGFESDTESRHQRRPSVGSSASAKSNKSAGSWGWRESSKKGRMQRLFLFNKPGSKHNIFKEAPDTDQVSLILFSMDASL